MQLDFEQKTLGISLPNQENEVKLFQLETASFARDHLAFPQKSLDRAMFLYIVYRRGSIEWR